VEMLLAHHGQWQCVGRWRGVGCSWPHLIAATTKAVMDLHTELREAGGRRDGVGDTGSPLTDRAASGELAGLLKAGLVSSGDEFIWDCRQRNVSHVVHVRSDGTLELADSGVCAWPTVAAMVLSETSRDGWAAFYPVSDGRTLADLRTEAYQRHEN
jgi:RAMA domain-containing protein